MKMDEKILHYFRDINYAYNDCTKYDKLKSGLEAYKEEIMKLDYKMEPIIFHLKHIKKMCLENPDCTGCPFQLKNNWAEYCMFGGPHWDDGVIPEDWELDELVEKVGENDGC